MENLRSILLYAKKVLPILGVIYVPVSRELYYGDVSTGKAYKTILNNSHEIQHGIYLMKQTEFFHLSLKMTIFRVVGSQVSYESGYPGLYF